MTAGYTGSEQRNRNSDWADFKTYDPEHSGFRILKRPISRSAPDWRFGPHAELAIYIIMQSRISAYVIVKRTCTMFTD